MSRRLTKLPLLKKKDSKESNLQVNRDQQQWDRQEAHFSGSHPSTSQDAATRRTTQLLPLLVKSSAAPTQARKRVQLPALVLPDLGQRTTLRTTPGTAQADDQQGEKEPVALPRVPERESSQRSSLSQGRRPSKALLPLYPELSDQCFQTFWESKEPLNGRSVTEMLEQMDEKEILDTILEHLRPSLHGISEAIGVVAFCHLPEILVALRQVGHFVRAKKPALQEAPFQDPHSCFERQIRTAVILCYGHAALGAQPEDLMPLAEHIVSEILFQYWTRNKDEALTKAFLTSVIRITKALVQTKSQDVHLPHKSELALNINEVIENEPMSPLSVRILHQAIIAITCMTRLKPTLNTEVMSKLVNTSIQKVFSLPAMTMTKVNAGSPNQSTYTQVSSPDEAKQYEIHLDLWWEDEVKHESRSPQKL
ncbi:maestro heat-like repeat family member 5 [Crotalus adamanteus]|uniref:Maestro heat-like repeat family member 5 n=1 Tax=Crotalus adamanteus TaxID=8729 RepID=A0AAW1AS17_CROAD